MPRIAIILPVYNHARYVEETLRSLFAQDISDYRIVAVDDGSTDTSLEILQRYRSRIQIVEGPHQGPAAARNRALNAVDSEFVAFMDADDLCASSRLRLGLDKLESEGLDLVASTLSFIDASGNALPGLWKCPAHASADYWGALLERNWIGTPSVLLRRGILGPSGLFDERFTHAEDYDLWLRIGRAGTIGYIDTPLIRCRRHASNTSRDIGAHQRFETMALQKVDPEEARSAFAQLHADPGLCDEAWIWFLLRSGNSTIAAELADALQRHPHSHALRFASGVLHYDHGEWDPARSVFAELRRRDPASHHNLAVLAAYSGDLADAELHLNAVLRAWPDYHDARANLEALLSGRALRLTRRPLRESLIPIQR